jgi:hypothetical protein
LCCSRAERQPTLLRNGVASHEFYLCHLLPVGQWQSLRQHGRRNTHKNAIAKISRHATAQSRQKIAQKNCINTAPTHKAIIYKFFFRFLLAYAHAFPCWSLSIFCCILFFITIKFYKMKVYIVQLNDELKIFKVQPEDEAGFLEKYQSFIIAEAGSLQEVIQAFIKIKDKEAGQ